MTMIARVMVANLVRSASGARRITILPHLTSFTIPKKSACFMLQATPPAVDHRDTFSITRSGFLRFILAPREDGMTQFKDSLSAMVYGHDAARMLVGDKILVEYEHAGGQFQLSCEPTDGPIGAPDQPGGYKIIMSHGERILSIDLERHDVALFGEPSRPFKRKDVDSRSSDSQRNQWNPTADTPF